MVAIGNEVELRTCLSSCRELTVDATTCKRNEISPIFLGARRSASFRLTNRTRPWAPPAEPRLTHTTILRRRHNAISTFAPQNIQEPLVVAHGGWPNSTPLSFRGSCLSNPASLNSSPRNMKTSNLPFSVCHTLVSVSALYD